MKPMYALSYGMFASHGPAYDSTFANLTVEDSKLGKCLLGGFNVSNLMGITRRMIDIGKKITFYFLQNV